MFPLLKKKILDPPGVFNRQLFLQMIRLLIFFPEERVDFEPIKEAKRLCNFGVPCIQKPRLCAFENAFIYFRRVSVRVCVSSAFSGSKIAPRPFGKDESRAEVRKSIGFLPSSGNALKLALGRKTPLELVILSGFQTKRTFSIINNN